MRSGVDVIYQAELLSDAEGDQPATLGRPDFLVRAELLAAPDGEPRPAGAWYEVVDAKLARTAKARAVLQSRTTAPFSPVRNPSSRGGCTSLWATARWPRSR